jgi:sulfoquinovose isomerase
MTRPELPIHDPALRRAFAENARAQIAFFRASLNDQGGFDLLDYHGAPIPGHPQELHATTRMVHSYALAHAWGQADCQPMVDAGLSALWTRHRDAEFGGYAWSITSEGVSDATKLAYGHVFVLLAASSAMALGHEDAARLMQDIEHILDQHFWDEQRGLLREEYGRDWSVISQYRGMNANMHGAEALMAAYEATGREVFLHRAGRILRFFTQQLAPENGWRIPEHFTAEWEIDHGFEGNPMFRPAGTTPGHALEFARLILQYRDLSGQKGDDIARIARALIETALSDAWLADGGLAYTVSNTGQVLRPDRYWWPVTEGIGALAALMKCDPRASDADWFLRLWDVAQTRFIDHERGGWYPEIGRDGQPQAQQFIGKPDIYHSLQAMLYPLCPRNAHMLCDLRTG